MSQEQDIAYVMPQTKQAMVEHATEELMGLLRELPGGNTLTDKQIEALGENCVDRLNEAKTFEEMQERVNAYLREIQTIAENADVRNVHWRETEARIEEVQAQLGNKFDVVIEMLGQANARVEMIMQEAIGKMDDIIEGKTSPFEHSQIQQEEPQIDPEVMEALAGMPSIDLDGESPFDFEDDTMESIASNTEAQSRDVETMESVASHNIETQSLDEQTMEAVAPRVVERDGQKYVVTKEAEYDDQGKLIQPGEIRTMEAIASKTGYVVLPDVSGTFNRVLTPEQFIEYTKNIDNLKNKQVEKKQSIGDMFL